MMCADQNASLEGTVALGSLLDRDLSDVLVRIFHLLDSREDLLSCRLVCRAWRDLFTARRDLLLKIGRTWSPANWAGATELRSAPAAALESAVYCGSSPGDLRCKRVLCAVFDRDEIVVLTAESQHRSVEAVPAVAAEWDLRSRRVRVYRASDLRLVRRSSSLSCFFSSSGPEDDDWAKLYVNGLTVVVFRPQGALVLTRSHLHARKRHLFRDCTKVHLIQRANGSLLFVLHRLSPMTGEVVRTVERLEDSTGRLVEHGPTIQRDYAKITSLRDRPGEDSETVLLMLEGTVGAAGKLYDIWGGRELCDLDTNGGREEESEGGESRRVLQGEHFRTRLMLAERSYLCRVTYRYYKEGTIGRRLLVHAAFFDPVTGVRKANFTHQDSKNLSPTSRKWAFTFCGTPAVFFVVYSLGLGPGDGPAAYAKSGDKRTRVLALRPADGASAFSVDAVLPASASRIKTEGIGVTKRKTISWPPLDAFTLGDRHLAVVLKSSPDSYRYLPHCTGDGHHVEADICLFKYDIPPHRAKNGMTCRLQTRTVVSPPPALESTGEHSWLTFRKAHRGLPLFSGSPCLVGEDFGRALLVEQPCRCSVNPGQLKVSAFRRRKRQEVADVIKGILSPS